MQVSVIIPNYNHAAYLNQRIDSVLNQTYADFEIIILDDCSTDNSVEIINTYKNNSKITHIIFNKENSGSTFKQWEKGVALAKGKYIWIAESDDYADANFLQLATHRLYTHPEAGLFFCNYHSIDEEGQIINDPVSIYTPEFKNHFNTCPTMNGRYFCEHYLYFSCLLVNASAVVFIKDLFVNADKSYAGLKLAGDWRMWVNICYSTNVIFSVQKLDYFRMHTNNVRSAKARLMGIETIYNLIYFLKKTTDHTLQTKLKNNICKTWVYSFYLNKNLVTNGKLLKKIMAKDLLFPFRLLRRVMHKLNHLPETV